MWIVFVGVLSSWLVVAVAVSFGVARAIMLREAHAPALPMKVRSADSAQALAA